MARMAGADAPVVVALILPHAATALRLGVAEEMLVNTMAPHTAPSAVTWAKEALPAGRQQVQWGGRAEDGFNKAFRILET